MKLLLDTHAFLWWDSDPDRLSPQVLSLCQNPANVMLFSVASAWEMQIGSLKWNSVYRQDTFGKEARDA